MRRVGNGADNLLGTIGAQLVEQKRHEDGEWKAAQQRQGAEHRRIDQGGGEVVAAEEAHEVLQPHPLAGPDALAELVILEGNLDKEHGLVLEHQEINDNRNQHQIHRPVFSQRSQPGSFPRGHKLTPLSLAGRISLPHQSPGWQPGKTLADLPRLRFIMLGSLK